MHWPEFVKIRDKPSAFPELDYPDISAEKDLLAAVSPQRHLRAGGDPYKRLLQLDKWIPAFAGMMLRSFPEARNSDSFTRSFAGMTLRKGG